MRYWHWWPCIDPSWGALEWPLPWWCWQDLLDHLQRQRQRQRQSVRNTEAKLCRKWGVKFLFSDDRWSCQWTTNKLAMIFRVCVCMKLRIRLKNKKLRQFNRSSITKHHPKLWRKMCTIFTFQFWSCLFHHTTQDSNNSCSKQLDSIYKFKAHAIPENNGVKKLNIWLLWKILTAAFPRRPYVHFRVCSVSILLQVDHWRAAHYQRSQQ